jgi:hypothetical protein
MKNKLFKLIKETQEKSGSDSVRAVEKDLAA